MGVLGVIFWAIGISMGYLYLLVSATGFQQVTRARTDSRLCQMGVILGGGVAPVAMCILYANANRRGCIFGAWIGLAAGLTAWLVTASTLNDGVLSIATTGGDYPMLAGNLASFCTSGLICLTTSWIWPAHFDWEITRAIRAPDNETRSSSVVENSQKEIDVDELKKDTSMTPGLRSARDSVILEEAAPGTLWKLMFLSDAADVSLTSVANTETDLRSAFRLALFSSVILFIILMILVSARRSLCVGIAADSVARQIPLPLFFSSHVYPVGGFTGWIAIIFVWLMCKSWNGDSALLRNRADQHDRRNRRHRLLSGLGIPRRAHESVQRHHP